MECDSAEVSMIQDLVAAAKRQGLFETMWGKSVRVSNTAGNKTKPQDLTNMNSYICRHVNYHSSMICEDLMGITNLDMVFHSQSEESNGIYVSSIHSLSIHQTI